MRSRTRRWLAGVTTLALSALVLVLPSAAGPELGGGVGAAAADVPSVAATEPFTAPLCAGSTTTDPSTVVVGAHVLTEVWGQRLADYNAGHPVVLYGGSGTNGGTPACVLRYVEGVGPVAEWSFCTDAHSSPCTTTDANGAIYGTGLRDLTGNDRLTDDQETIIGYLVRHGWDLDTPYYAASSRARADGTSNERTELQLLVWCVSDPDYVAGIRAGHCATNLSAADQAQILLRVPDSPELVLEVDDVPGTLPVGGTAEITLTTNLFDQPIAVTVDGGEVAVCGDTSVATLTGGELVVSGTDPDVPVTVTLCLTGTSAGPVEITASGTPLAAEHITWKQTDAACQVFATFERELLATLTDGAQVVFEAESTPTPTPTEPSATPTEPSATPSEPSATPTEPSATPTEPSATPSDVTEPSATPSASAPSSPGATPTASSTAPTSGDLPETGASSTLSIAAVSATLLLLGTVLAARRRRLVSQD